MWAHLLKAHSWPGRQTQVALIQYDEHYVKRGKTDDFSLRGNRMISQRLTFDWAFKINEDGGIWTGDLNSRAKTLARGRGAGVPVAMAAKQIISKLGDIKITTYYVHGFRELSILSWHSRDRLLLFLCLSWKTWRLAQSHVIVDAGCLLDSSWHCQWNTYMWPSHVTWASSQHGIWVLRVSTARQPDASHVTFYDSTSEVVQCCFCCIQFDRTKSLMSAHIQRGEPVPTFWWPDSTRTCRTRNIAGTASDHSRFGNTCPKLKPPWQWDPLWDNGWIYEYNQL